MAYDYDKLFRETPDALGAPTPVFVEFFKRVEKERARVLDVGCGQGRDAVFIARLGHDVVGVDLSPHGIRDLRAAAQKEGLAVEGIVADVVDYLPEGKFDIILIDRTLHMLPEGKRLGVLERLLDHVCAGGWVLIADESRNMDGFRRIISGHKGGWSVEYTKPGYLFVRRT